MQTKLTPEVKDALGIVHLESRLYPRRHFVPCLGETDIHESATVHDILRLIWESGERYGEEKGKKLKCQEIKKALEIDLD